MNLRLSPYRTRVGSMTFLVDGYNLLHALGLASRKMEGKGLERARFKMLDWLSQQHGDKASQVYVVFDALHATRRDQTHQIYRGIEIEFAFGELADDRIEVLIQQEKQPKSLVVVSNDSRLQLAAKRRGCVSWTSDEYVDYLIREEEKQTSKLPAPEKNVDPTDAEMAEWLAVFEKRK